MEGSVGPATPFSRFAPEEANGNRAILPTRIMQRGGPAFELLLEAYEDAQELGRTVWDFAVEVDFLREAGLNVNDLRWLLCKKLIEHARETTLCGDAVRSFRPERSLSFHRRTCLVLCPEGLAVARQAQLATNASPGFAGRNGVSRSAASVSPQLPKWDSDRQELRLGDLVVKRFKLPAANQETILAAFEEESWPARIDDPLPPRPDQDPKRRLHDTINSLNRHQKNSVIKFLGDGSGEGICWELAGRMSASGVLSSDPAADSLRLSLATDGV